MTEIEFKHAHRFKKFNEEQVFCECGEFKSAPKPRKAKAEAPAVVGCNCHHSCWHHYTYYPQWTWTSTPTIYYGTTAGSTTIGSGSSSNL